MYKIADKIFTARLKTVEVYLVAPFQSAIIEGRNIHDNVIGAHMNW